MCNHFIIIGISDSKEPCLDTKALAAISANSVFSGGKRHHEIVRPLLPADHVWIDITVPLDSVFAAYAKHDRIVVFASGDPLFFGFANTVMRKLPDARIELLPAFNSLQTLAHRLLMPYHDMRIVSLTGRPWHEFDAALIGGCEKIGVLTDGEHTPQAIARRMMEYGYTGYAIAVGEHLGNEEKESVVSLSLQEAAGRTFSRPNCAVVYVPGQHGTPTTAAPVPGSRTSFPRHSPGIPDHLFELLDGRPRMITKAPIRMLTLAALELRDRSSLWDIGFCTGSVSIEARLMFPRLHVTSFEIRPEGRRLMDINSRRFGAPGITAVIGDFMELDVSGHPCPDAVFIGGHGGRLGDMMRKVAGYMPEGGVMVFNSVSDDSRREFCRAAESLGMALDEPLHVAINDYNPIYILKART